MRMRPAFWRSEGLSIEQGGEADWEVLLLLECRDTGLGRVRLYKG